MSEIVFPSTKAGNEVDRAVTAALETIPAQLTTIGSNLDELESQVIYDVSANNNGATFASLSALLSSENLSTLIPIAVRSGGMSIRFIQTSDHKYVQARLMANAFTTDVTQWQGVDETPTAGSQNLVESGGVASYLPKIIIEGKGSTINKVPIKYLQPGRTYKITFYNIWNLPSGLDDTLFAFGLYKVVSGVETYFVRVLVRDFSNIKSEYIVTIPDDAEYVNAGGRAVVGEQIIFNIEPYTDIARIDTEVDDLLLKIKRIGHSEQQSVTLGRNKHIYGYSIGLVSGHKYKIEVFSDSVITGTQLSLNIHDADTDTRITAITSNLLSGSGDSKTWDGSVKAFEFEVDNNYDNATIDSYCSADLSNGVLSYNIYDITYDEINSKLDFIDSIDGEFLKADTIYNGTPNNHSNTTKVRTSPISVNAGDTIRIVTDRPLSAEGNYYATYKYYKNSNGDVIQNVVASSAEYMTQVVPDNAATTEIGLTELTSGGDTVTLRTTDFYGYYIGYKVFSIKDEVERNTNGISALETLTTSQGDSIANNASGISKEKELSESSFYGISSSYAIAAGLSAYDTTHIRIVQGHIYEITVSSETAFSGTQLSLKIVDYTTNSGFNITSNLLSGNPKTWNGSEKTYRFTPAVDIKDAKIGSYASADIVGAGGIINFTIRDITIELLQNPEPKTDIFAFNPDAEYLPKIANLKRATAVDGIDIVPVSFLWFSDQHDNSTNNIKRINEWRNHYATYIDDVLNCGDSVATKWNNSFDAFINNGGDKMLMVIGNHDVADPNVSDNYYNGEVSKTDVYNKFMGIMDDATLGVVRPSDAATAGKCYYYKDYANIRMIVVDVSTEDNVWIEDESHSKTYYEAQCTWLTNVLNDAKTAGKSVIIASHFPSSINENQDAGGFSYYTTPSSPSAGRKIHEEFHNIVDTFISGGGEFITWLCGHVHSNRLGTVVNHANQQIICVTTSSYTIFRNTRINNVVRSAGNKSEDAFNMISFDTINKLIKIVRIGLNYDGFYRKIDGITLNYSTHAVVNGG